MIFDYLLEYSTPSWFVVTSAGGTARAVGNMLGLYEVRNGMHQDRPVYKMVGGDFFLYYSDTKHWMVGPEVGGSVGFIRTLSTGDMESPLVGWSVFNGKGWVVDQNLMVEPYNGKMVSVTGTTLQLSLQDTSMLESCMRKWTPRKCGMTTALMLRMTSPAGTLCLQTLSLSS